jgi:DNA polymerase-4
MPQPEGEQSVRRILHCDMDSFFAAVEMRDDPSLRGKPVVVGGDPRGRGVVAAASYEVRKYGVHSAMPAARAIQLCPHAVFLKPDFRRYREESGEIFEIFRRFTPLVQPVSIDEAYLDVTEHLAPWGSATRVAQEIRRRVREERRLTVSIGVAPNKLVAKIASDFHKPDGLTVVHPHKVEAFLAQLPVRKLRGVGPRTEEALAELGIETVEDLRRFSRDELTRRFGRHGGILYEFARGIDERAVVTHRERKSLGHENTYREDLRGLDRMDAEMDRFADEVARGLRQRELLASTFTVKVRYGDFTTVTRSKTLPAPTAEAGTIARVARELLRKTDAPRLPVRLLGVTASGLSGDDAERQLWLFEP